MMKVKADVMRKYSGLSRLQKAISRGNGSSLDLFRLPEISDHSNELFPYTHKIECFQVKARRLFITEAILKTKEVKKKKFTTL